MPTKMIIIEIPFNNRSKTDPNSIWNVGLTKSWIEYRMSIFMKYTLQSLKKQTSQKFTALVQYAEASENIIRQTLSKYEPLPSNIQFVPKKLYRRHLQKRSLGYEYVYLVRLDCDDTYHKSFIQQLHDYIPKPDTCALINQEGYVYDSMNHRMATLSMTSPPFYTWIYKTEEYFNGKKYPAPSGHKGVIINKHEILTSNNKRNFMIVVHNQNTLNQKLLSKYEFESDRSKVDAILKNFI